MIGSAYQEVAKEFIELIGKKALYGDTDSTFIGGLKEGELDVLLKVLEQYIGITMKIIN